MARKAVSNDRYRLSGTYERLRRTLLDLPSDGRLDRELSYWVLPSDRRLPIALLDRRLSDLLTVPLEELMSTPGIGQKKILGFFDLLRRIAKASASEEPFGLQGGSPGKGGADQGTTTSRGGFVPSAVSEALWSTWCDSIRRSGLGEQYLGRVAPSLRNLPTVIWHTPLSTYIDLSLAEIRCLRTHGEKRVHAILEVFGTAHEAVSTAALHENLEVDLAPRFVPRLSRWLTETAWEERLPDEAVLHEKIVEPLLRQVSIDLGDHVAALASDRLRLDDQGPSVKQQAESLGVTRARVYQLLEDCAKVLDVRWPEGRWLLAPLASKYATASPVAIGLIHGVRDLFFPAERPVQPDSSRHQSPGKPQETASRPGRPKRRAKTGSA